MAVSKSAIPLGQLLPFLENDLSAVVGDSLSKVGVTSFAVADFVDGLQIGMNLDLDDDLALEVPGLSGFAFVLGNNQEGPGPRLDLLIYPYFRVALSNVDLAIRFPSSLLKPVEEDGNGSYTAVPSSDGEAATLEIGVENVCFAVDSNGTVDFSLLDDTIALSCNHPFMIGDSGVVVEVSSLSLVQASGSASSAIPGGSFGVLIEKAEVHLPAELSQSFAPTDLKLEDLAIGSGGFSGKISSTWSGSKTAKLFGMALGLKKIGLEFKQNALIGAEITGQITLPYFNQAVDVELGFDLDGNVSVTLDKTSTLLSFSIENVLDVKVDSLGFKRQDGKYYIHISGEIKPKVGGLSWPGFKVKDLTIDSDGNVSLDGGWLNLPTQYSLDFYGFQMEITKIGFGSEDDGSKWIGFSGGIKLMDGLPIGASVEGLRIKWTSDGDVSVTLNGIGVKFEVPGTLRFSASVSHVEDGSKHYFKGAVKLELIALGLSLDATLLIGKNEEDPAYNYFFVFLDVQLPAGIPLFSSGLALYGLSGLFADEMEPDKKDSEDWYDDWYMLPKPGVTDPETKWTDQRDSLAVGAGVTIGTVFDNGFTFSCRALLVVVIPGPIILLEGRAQILKERTDLAGSDDPPFKALMVIDARAGTFQFNIEATYRLPSSSGAIIDAYAGAEAYFAGADDWHFYLGQKDPREKRIRAYIIKLIEAEAYFMIDPTKIQMGARVAYSYGWFFGPVKAGLEAWIEGGAVISWKPALFYGYLWLHGALVLKVFGFGFSLSAEAKIEVQTPTPYYVLIALTVTLDLPWFLPDIDIDLELKWEEDVKPAVPLPLKEIAVGHLKVKDTWTTPRLPAFDTDEDGYWNESESLSETPDDTDESWLDSKLPVVPMDARPVLTFTRPVDDLLNLNGAPASPDSETVGKNDLRFELVSLKLEKWPAEGGTGWETVAYRSSSPKKSVGDLYGQWQAAGDKSSVATKLILWSKNAFDYLRAAGRTWADYFIEQNSSYPCQPEKVPVTVCVDFDDLSAGTVLPSVVLHQDLIFIANQPLPIVAHPSAATGTQRAAVLNLGLIPMRIAFPESVADVTLHCDGGLITVRAYYQGAQVGSTRTGTASVQVEADAIDWIEVTGSELWLLQICYVTMQAKADALAWKTKNDGVLQMTEQWKGSGKVFEPNTRYRLEVVTRVRYAAKGTQPADTSKWKEAATFVEYGYFQTQGPPGLVKLAPKTQGTRTYAHPLTDLSLYLTSPGRTIPGDEQRARKGEPPRPVYRGYDVGLEFNENYVDLMYRLAARDLGLYIYDNNRQPVRDVEGKLIVTPNYWGQVSTLSLTLQDNLWIYTINQSTCAVIDTEKIQRSSSTSLADSQLVLRPRTLHRVLAIPLLLHDDFHSGTITAWGTPAAEGSQGGQPQWQVKTETKGSQSNEYLIQTSGHYGTAADSNDQPGTYLVRGSTAWTDYRLSVTVRSSDDGAIGVLFRFKDKSNYYRFSMDKQQAFRRLVKKVGGKVSVLAEDGVPYERNRDYQVTVEVVGSQIRIYLDGEKLFGVKDTALTAGEIGLYCRDNTGARFDDVRVDNFRSQAGSVYSFDLVTSRYVDFAHHLHAFRDVAWDLTLDTALTTSEETALAAKVKAASAKGLSYSPLETKDFYGLFNLSQRTTPSAVDISLLRTGSQRYGLLLESPEPIIWNRLDLPQVAYADRLLAPAKSPGTMKLIGVTLPPEAQTIDQDANDETVDIMLRDDLDPTGYVVQHLRRPGSVEPVTKETILLTESFQSGMSRWTVVDEGTDDAPSQWAVTDGVLKQTSSIQGEGADKMDKPGTYALAGDVSWTDYRVIVQLRSDDEAAIGVMFRYTDEKNYYRFSMDSHASYRCLIKKVNDVSTVLWQDSEPFETGCTYTLTLDAFGDRLQGFLDGLPLFDVTDTGVSAGQIGLYSWGNTGANFLDVVVKAIPPKADLLFADDFSLSTLADWTVVDEGTEQGPSDWAVTDGVLTQTSSIQGEGTGRADKPGTCILAGDASWSNYRLAVRLQSEDGAIGVVFRYQDADNYYRFSMSRQPAYRQLVRKAGGSTAVLWRDSTAYEQDRLMTLAVDAFDDRLQGFLDGVPVFDVTDDDPLALSQGEIGLYCRANAGASFDGVRVSQSVPEEKEYLTDDFQNGMGNWKVVDEGSASSAAAWSVQSGVLVHQAETHGGSLDPASPDKPGTFVVRGDESWTDYQVSVRLRSDSEYAIGIMARYRDPDNYYRFSMDHRLGYHRLIKKVSGTVYVLWQDTTSYAVGQDYQVVMELSGSQIQVLVDGAQVCSVLDGDLNSGKVGLYCWGNAKASFYDVQVTTKGWIQKTLLDEDFDVFDTRLWSVVELAPGTVFPDWQVSGGTLQHLNQHPGTAVVTGTIHWTSLQFSTRLRTAERGAVGLTFAYQQPDNAFYFIADQSQGRLVRQKGSSVDTLWQGAETLSPDRWHTLTVELAPNRITISLDRTQLVDLPGTGGEGQLGLCAWKNDGAQFDSAKVTQMEFGDVTLLDEDFSTGMGSWTVVDEGEASPPAAWAVLNGVLVQTSEAHGGSLDPASPDKPGTFVITGDSAWADYRLAVRLRSESEYGIGVMFRYTDADNYYRFSMDQRLGYRRLVKKVSGKVSVLWEDQETYEVGQAYLVTVDAMGDLLQVYLDGVPLCAEVDNALAQGSIGLYSWGNAGAQFEAVSVLAPQFVDYYRFERETRMPAGTCFRIHAGASDSASDTGGGIESRYVAQFGEQGWPLLSSTGETLRIVDSNGRAGHCRSFLPDNAYTKLTVAVLRARDGTAAHLFFPTSSKPVGPIADGHYRLTFTFHRDISSSNSKAPVLRRAGSSQAETATLEFSLP